MKVILDAHEWRGELPDEKILAPESPAMFSPQTRALEPEEKALYEQMTKAGYSEMDIAKKLAELGEKGWGMGAQEYGEAREKRAGLEQMLKALESGEKSYVDEEATNKYLKNARDQAVSSFGDVDRTLAEQYAKRGIYGGGQHRGDIRRFITKSQGETMANIAAQQGMELADKKMQERSSALNALLGLDTGQFNLGTTMMGMGQSGYGSGGQLFEGAGRNAASGLNALTGRPQTQSIFSQLAGAAIGLISPFAKRN